MLKIKGIDISRAQEQFDFTAAVSAGVKFVIIRAGIRTDEDTYFRRNIEQCKKLGIDFGCYWYVTATDTAELDRQINACVKAIGNEKPSYPVFCDMEEQRQIIGYNNSVLANCTEPELTSIDSKVEQLSVKAVNILMQVLSGHDVPAENIIAADIIKRNTTNF